MQHTTVAGIPITVQDIPRGDKIVVLPILRATRGLLVDMEENRERPERGIVIAKGPGGISLETGRPVPIESQLGELVYFGKYAGIAFEVDSLGRELLALIMRDSEVLLASPKGLDYAGHTTPVRLR